MKILQINSTLNWGSTGRIAEEIGRLVIDCGGESFIAYGRYANPSQSNAIKIGNKWEIYSHVLKTRLFDKHGLASKKATNQLIKQIKEIKPDIIHLHNIHGYYLNYPILFKYLASSNIPVVWTLHDCWAFTGHCSYFSFAGCEQWKSACFNCLQKSNYPSSYFLDNSKDNYQEKMNTFTTVKNMIIVPVSNWLASLVKESFLSKYPLEVIHNGIDLNLFNHKENVNVIKPKNKFTILGVANIWEDRKGLNDFILLRKLLPIEYHIILIGLSSSQIKKLPEGIEGLMRTNSIQELVSFYTKSDVYFNPTWEDNFPTTNLEALACGTPVITYRTGGSPEAINEHTGFVVKQGDLNATISAIEIIKKKGKEFYSKACREQAVSCFDKNARYAEYLKLYKKIITNK